MAAVAFDYGGWAWDVDFNEISRPCLRKVELEVDLSLELDDEWFVQEVEEDYLPDARFPWPTAVGVAAIALAMWLR